MHFFKWKCESNVSDNAYDALRQLLISNGLKILSLDSTRRHLDDLLGLEIVKYDCCIKGCIAFVGNNILLGSCPHCGEKRFSISNGEELSDIFPDTQSYALLKPRAAFTYIPIIPRLRLLYASPTYSAKMRYPTVELTNKPWEDNPDGIRDIWEGNAMKHWKAQGTCHFAEY